MLLLILIQNYVFVFFIRLASSLSISPFYVCSLVRVLWYARMHWYDGRKFFVAIIKLVKVMNKLEKLMLCRRKVRNCTHVNVSFCRRNESWFAIRIAHKLNNANQSLTLTRKWQTAKNHISKLNGNANERTHTVMIDENTLQ